MVVHYLSVGRNYIMKTLVLDDVTMEVVVEALVNMRMQYAQDIDDPEVGEDARAEVKAYDAILDSFGVNKDKYIKEYIRIHE